MTNPYEAPQTTAGNMADNERADRVPDERPRATGATRLATLLMRLLGVYFTAGAIIYASGFAIQIMYVASKLGLEEALTHDYRDNAGLATSFVELVIGVYLLIGGRWVLEKVLTPVLPRPSDDIGDGDEEPSGDLPEATDPNNADTE